MSQTPGKFGVEIEMNYGPNLFSKADVARVLTTAGINAIEEGYNHDARPYWKIVHDGSVNRGCEVVSPILEGEAGIEELKKVAATLAASGATVDKTTGLHVHLDARTWSVRDFKRVLKSWVTNERAIDMIVAPSRRGSANQYCKSVLARLGNDHGYYDANTLINNPDRVELVRKAFDHIDTARTIGDLKSLMSYDRYQKVNLEAHGRHGTIEFRQHQGSLNAEKIEMWVRLLSGLVETAKKTNIRRWFRDRSALCDAIWRLNTSTGGTKETRIWLTKRAKEFAKAEGRKIWKQGQHAVEPQAIPAPAQVTRATPEIAERLGATCHSCGALTVVARNPLSCVPQRFYCRAHTLNGDLPLTSAPALPTIAYSTNTYEDPQFASVR